MPKDNISATVDAETKIAVAKLGTLKGTQYHKRSFSQLVDFALQRGIEAINKDLKKVK